MEPTANNLGTNSNPNPRKRKKSWFSTLPWLLLACLLAYLAAALHLFLLWPHVSITTGELKPRSLYIDENAIFHKNVNQLHSRPYVRNNHQISSGISRKSKSDGYSNININSNSTIDDSSDFETTPHVLCAKINEHFSRRRDASLPLCREMAFDPNLNLNKYVNREEVSSTSEPSSTSIEKGVPVLLVIQLHSLVRPILEQREEVLLVFPYYNRVLPLVAELVYNLLDLQATAIKHSKFVRVLLVPVSADSSAGWNDLWTGEEKVVEGEEILRIGADSKSLLSLVSRFGGRCSDVQLRHSQAFEYYLSRFHDVDDEESSTPAGWAEEEKGGGGVRTSATLVRESYVVDIATAAFRLDCQQRLRNSGNGGDGGGRNSSNIDLIRMASPAFIEVLGLSENGLQANMDIIASLLHPIAGGGTGNVPVVSEGVLNGFSSSEYFGRAVLNDLGGGKRTNLRFQIRPYLHHFYYLASKLLQNLHILLFKSDVATAQVFAGMHLKRAANLLGFLFRSTHGGSGLHSQLVRRNIDAVTLTLTLTSESNDSSDSNSNSKSNNINSKSSSSSSSTVGQERYYVLSDRIVDRVWSLLISALKLSENLHEELHHSQWYFIPMGSTYFVSFSEYMLTVFLLLFPLLMVDASTFSFEVDLVFSRNLKGNPNDKDDFNNNNADNKRSGKVSSYTGEVGEVGPAVEIPLKAQLISRRGSLLRSIAMLLLDLLFSVLSAVLLSTRLLSVFPQASYVAKGKDGPPAGVMMLLSSLVRAVKDSQLYRLYWDMSARWILTALVQISSLMLKNEKNGGEEAVLDIEAATSEIPVLLINSILIACELSIMYVIYRKLSRLISFESASVSVSKIRDSDVDVDDDSFCVLYSPYFNERVLVKDMLIELLGPELIWPIPAITTPTSVPNPNEATSNADLKHLINSSSDSSNNNSTNISSNSSSDPPGMIDVEVLQYFDSYQSIPVRCPAATVKLLCFSSYHTAATSLFLVALTCTAVSGCIGVAIFAAFVCVPFFIVSYYIRSKLLMAVSAVVDIPKPHVSHRESSFTDQNEKQKQKQNCGVIRQNQRVSTMWYRSISAAFARFVSIVASPVFVVLAFPNILFNVVPPVTVSVPGTCFSFFIFGWIENFLSVSTFFWSSHLEDLAFGHTATFVTVVILSSMVSKLHTRMQDLLMGEVKVEVE